ncbi:hypothetical protein DPMN_138896 [Dreissena polymorpha]|uniref:Uncharacterized protein n=1 Tax=Dreissena polymorpha TaxID=45954 RepID=A0A9D4JF50_DREPO|nr:hypothetical protein DPMN_138896 [Dreissena polymorpha]
MRASVIFLTLNLFCILELSVGNVLPLGSTNDATNVCSYGEQEDLPNPEQLQIMLMNARIDVEGSSTLTAVNIQFGEESLTYLMSGLQSPIKASTRVTVWRQDMIIPAPQINHVTDCVIVGHLENNNDDRIHISLCDKLIGWFEYGNWSYTIINGTVKKAHDFREKHVEILVSKTERRRTTRESDSKSGGAHIRERRETTPNITIETVLILDELYIALMAKAGYTSDAQLTDLMKLKWLGVQAEWGKANQLGYNIALEIKEIVFWRTNPAWYIPSKVLGEVTGLVFAAAQILTTYIWSMTIYMCTLASRAQMWQERRTKAKYAAMFINVQFLRTLV